MKAIYKKVFADDKVRYIDQSGKWWKEAFNGKFTPSKPMNIVKVYGDKEIDIIDEGVFGLRVN